MVRDEPPWRELIDDPEAFLDASEALEQAMGGAAEETLDNQGRAALHENPYSMLGFGPGDFNVIRSGDAILRLGNEDSPVHQPAALNVFNAFSAALSFKDDELQNFEEWADTGIFTDDELELGVPEGAQQEVAGTLPSSPWQSPRRPALVESPRPPSLGPPLPAPRRDEPWAELQAYVCGGETVIIEIDELLDLDNPAEVLPDEFDDMPPLDSGSDTEPPCTTQLDTDDENNDEQKVKDYFELVGEAQRAPKRRRLRSKATVVEPPPAPSQKLKHAAASRGLCPGALKKMLLVGLPLVIINCFVFLEAMTPLSSAARTDAAELFSGAARVAQAFEYNDFEAAQFDYERHDVFENILRPEGILTLLRILRDVRPGGLCHWATVCSTWVYLSHASTGRSAAFPEGDSTIRVTRSANCMAARVAVLIILTFIFKIKIIHEQPLSSLMSSSKYFVWLRNVLRHILGGEWYECTTWMGAYGHELQKPTQLLSTDTLVYGLRRSLTPEQRLLCDSSEGVRFVPCDESSLRRRVVGAPKGLKASQEYPVAYGEMVFQEWRKARKQEDPNKFDESDVDSDEDVPWEEFRKAARECNWAELRLESLARLLNIPGDKLLP